MLIPLDEYRPLGITMSETVQLDRASDPQAVRGYAFYDWGKSSFETSVTSAVGPAWFGYLFLKANGLDTVILGQSMTGDAVWSLGVTAAALLVALVSPSLGVIADGRAIKMWWLRVFTIIGAGATLLLAFSPMFDVSRQWVWLVIMFVIANIGLNGAGVFYNALLPHMGTDDEMDRISNLAYAYGYIGGGLLLLFHFILFGLVEGDWVIPFIMATSGVWWMGFAMVTFKYVPEPPIENEMEKLGVIASAKMATGEVIKTIKSMSSFRTLFIYMLAFFFFIDGINSVTALAGIYGIVVLGLTAGTLMLTILIIQFVAAPCAIGFTKLAEKTSTKNALTISLVGWVIVIVGAMSFAPLSLTDHVEHDIQFDWDSDGDGIADTYDDNIDGDWYSNEVEIAAGTDPYDPSSHPDGLSTTWVEQRIGGAGQYVITVGETAYDLGIAAEGDEQDWANEWNDMMAFHENEYYTERVVYSFNDPLDSTMIVSTSDIDRMTDFFASFDAKNRFSYSVSNGPLDTERGMGDSHPTSIGDGPVDIIPEKVRASVWEPMGIGVNIQFLLLGCMAGALLGGSQGLARSLFGQMVPETRSAEFFGFFGFFGKVAALMGPAMYTYLTITYDSRVGVASFCVLIIIGTVLMRSVDVDAGRADAQAEDARNRGIKVE